MSPRREWRQAEENAEPAPWGLRLDGEATALLLFTAAAATAAFGGGSSGSSAGTLLPGMAFLALCLGWRLLARSSWSRWRAPMLVALRLLLAAPAAVPLLRLSRMRAAAPRAADVIDGPLGDLHFLFILTVASGTAGLILVRALCVCGGRHWWAVFLPVPERSAEGRAQRARASIC